MVVVGFLDASTWNFRKAALIDTAIVILSALLLKGVTTSTVEILVKRRWYDMGSINGRRI